MNQISKCCFGLVVVTYPIFVILLFVLSVGLGIGGGAEEARLWDYSVMGERISYAVETLETLLYVLMIIGAVAICIVVIIYFIKLIIKIIKLCIKSN